MTSKPFGKRGRNMAANLSFCVNSFSQICFSNDSLEIKHVNDTGQGTKGVSGDPVFRVSNREGRFIGIIKAFRKEETFNAEQVAIKTLTTLAENTLLSKHHQLVNIFGRLSIHIVSSLNTNFYLGLTPALGDGLDDLLGDLLLQPCVNLESPILAGSQITELERGADDSLVNSTQNLSISSGSPEARSPLEASDALSPRPSGVPAGIADLKLKQVIKLSAEVLATLHNNTQSDKEADCDRYIRQIEDMLSKLQKLQSIDNIRGRLQSCQPKIKILIEQVKNSKIKGCIIHGDSHPGNIFADPANENITLIDTPSLTDSIWPENSTTGKSPAMRDYSNFLVRTRDICIRFLLKENKPLDTLQDVYNPIKNIFRETYRALAEYNKDQQRPHKRLQYIRSLLGTIFTCNGKLEDPTKWDSCKIEQQVMFEALTRIEKITNKVTYENQVIQMGNRSVDCSNFLEQSSGNQLIHQYVRVS